MRQILCMLCFFLIVGPILIIVGAVFLKAAYDDSRGANVKLYNNAAYNWDHVGRSTFASIHGQNITLAYQQGASTSDSSILFVHSKTNALPLHDNMKDVYVYSLNQYYEGSFLVSMSDQLYNQGVEMFVPPMNQSLLPVNNLMKCSTIKRTTRHCTRRKNRRLLLATTNTNNRPTHHGTHNDNSNCISIVHYEHTLRVMDRIDLTLESNQLQYVSDMTSCKSTNQEFRNLRSVNSDSSSCHIKELFDINAQSAFTIKVRVFSKQDPYILAQKVTWCWLSFGMTAESKASIGIGLLVSGIILTIFVVGIMFCLIKRSDTNHTISSKPSEYNNPTYNSGINMQQQKFGQQQNSSYGYPLPNPLLSGSGTPSVAMAPPSQSSPKMPPRPPQYPPPPSQYPASQYPMPPLAQYSPAAPSQYPTPAPPGNGNQQLMAVHVENVDVV